MKLFKLWVHQQNFSEDDLILNPKEFPNEKEGDILEIYHPDEDNTRLLLQIKSINPEFQQKDTISIEQSVANFFQLRTYWDVEVTKVEPKDVFVDMVELLFKDQFVTRSEMWRFSKQLVGSCVYITKKLSHFGVRAQVMEIWTKGEKVSCGVISDDTRVSRRIAVISPTSDFANVTFANVFGRFANVMSRFANVLLVTSPTPNI